MTWREVFGHDEPYEAQVDGIETVRETADDDGFVLVEGACGTGKTMLALTAGIDLVRDPSTKFERVAVLTSVKQQLRQFEEDLRTINGNLPPDHQPVSGITLVGKADVCPYNLAGAGGIDDGNVYERCEGLRERTRNLADSDATSGADLAERARRQQTALGESASYLRAAGEPAPYAPDTAEFEDTEYCPFYAAYLADLPEDGSPTEAVPFDFADQGLIEPEDLVALSVEHGTCPHSMMGIVLGSVEVVIGNYYHAFDPQTVETFASALLDDSTFVVCDEAHMLEPRVRDLVSDRAADRSLREAEAELTRLIQPLRMAGDGSGDGPGAGDGGGSAAGARGSGSGGRGTAGRGTATGDLGDGDGATAVGGVSGPETVAGDDATSKAETVRAELAEAEVSRRELEETREFLRALRDELDRRVTAHLDRKHGDWNSDLADLPDEEIPLRDPEDPQPDEISEWAERAGYDGGAWVRAEAVGAFVGRVLDELEDEDKQRSAPGVGRTLANWYRLDHEGFFREIELDRTWDDTQPRDSWRRAYNARLALHNCVPSGPIGDRLSTFGGGVLLSATLAPLDVLREVTGLDRIESEEDRPVVERTYGLHFPGDNRESFAVATPKYTYDNRGPTPDPAAPMTDPRSEAHPDRDGGAGEDGRDGPSEAIRVRQDYVGAVRRVASGPGNVLVGMPNYAEAEWMAAALEDSALDKPVLLDESSKDDVTEDLKETFFAGEGKVLVTSLRGTLTEGVDYRGDRLRAAVVCGVPIINTASPRTRAVRTAYEREFGDGFRYALTVPAVRKARQAIGRVIRGPEETGVRVFVDERYARDSWDSVRDLIPDHEGFQSVSPDMLEFGLERFWDRVGE